MEEVRSQSECFSAFAASGNIIDKLVECGFKVRRYPQRLNLRAASGVDADGSITEQLCHAIESVAGLAAGCHGFQEALPLIFERKLDADFLMDWLKVSIHMLILT